MRMDTAPASVIDADEACSTLAEQALTRTIWGLERQWARWFGQKWFVLYYRVLDLRRIAYCTCRYIVLYTRGNHLWKCASVDTFPSAHSSVTNNMELIWRALSKRPKPCWDFGTVCGTNGCYVYGKRLRSSSVGKENAMQCLLREITSLSKARHHLIQLPVKMKRT